MAGEEISHTLIVSIGGQALAPEIAGKLTSATIDDTTVAPDMFVLRFLDDGATVLGKANVAIGTKVSLALARSGVGAPQPLLEAEVTAFETQFSPVGTHTVIRGYDTLHRLSRGRTVKAYVNQKAGDIVSDVAQRNGLRTGQVDGSLGSVIPHVSQGGSSDLAFLYRLAEQVGAVVRVSDGKVTFGRPVSAADAPGSQRSREDELVLEMGVNLVSLRASITAADQVSKVQVRGWDVKRKEPVIGSADAATTSARVDQYTPAKVAEAVGKPTWVQPWSLHSDSTSCQNAATAIADRVAGSFAELEGTARGNPKLRAGTAVNLVNVGKAFSGRYTLTATRHEFTKERGYLTVFTVSNASTRSVYGLAAGAAGGGGGVGAAGGRPGTVPGVLTALVTDIKDPEKLGRVRLQFPVMSDDFVSGWVRVVHQGAGKDRGLTLLPEVGDEVLVAFGMGEFGEPYVLGGLFNGKDLPKPGWDDHVDSTAGTVKRRGLTSRTGMVVELLESDNEQKLNIATNGGKQRITLVEKANAAIEIVSEGPVTITAKQNVTVTTNSGDLKLKATNISVEASSGLKLKSGGTASIEAQGSAELKGTTAKVTGQASAELSASGNTTVKGAIVQIN